VFPKHSVAGTHAVVAASVVSKHAAYRPDDMNV
jgi:hypothetical protein